MPARPKANSTKKLKLSVTQAKVVKAKIKAELTDTPQSIVAQEVWPNQTPGAAAVSMTRELKKANVNEALELAFEELQLTPMTLAATVANAIGAHKLVPIEGDLYETEHADHSIRLKAAGMAANWMGIGKQIEVPGGIHFHQHLGDKRQAYDE